MQKIDWDTFRYIVAIADAGSASSAAESLGVDASTVQRKITRFEREHGLTLFERRRSGFTPSVECAALIETARSMEEQVGAIARQVLGQDLRLEGKVSLTTTDSLAVSVLPPILAKYRKQHPQIHIDLTVTNNRLNLSRLDADVAVRPSLDPPPNLTAHRVSDLGLAVYSHPDLGTGAIDLDTITVLDLPWIGLGEGLEGSPARRWMLKNIAPQRIAVTADTFPSITHLCEQGAGLALTTAIIADASPHLVRRSPILSECSTALWVLTHPDTRHSARIKSLSNWLVQSLKEAAPQLAG
ncbi:LysR family transcriptional regulator [Pseudahrensia aquimaris]|uniref:LysR family transcriptional regulator n=1 Tax=Pseudahrensia aquimaris TaxID=744461 RepID=A0ABW3FB70_9HYPH